MYASLADYLWCLLEFVPLRRRGRYQAGASSKLWGGRIAKFGGTWTPLYWVAAYSRHPYGYRATPQMISTLNMEYFALNNQFGVKTIAAPNK